MQNFKNCSGLELKYTISSASTEGANFSSDEENYWNCKLTDLTPEQASHFFVPLSPDQKDTYKGLVNDLEVLYYKLDGEIQPVNIRDELTLAGNKVNLANIKCSKLCRRRNTIK